MANKPNVTFSVYYEWCCRQDNPGLRAPEEENLGKAIDPMLIEYKDRNSSFRIHQELRD